MNQLPWPMGPQPFDCSEGTCATDWKNWLRGFELFASASGITYEKKKEWLLHYAGPKVQSIYYNLPKESSKKKRSARTRYRKAVAKLTGYFAPQENTSYERHIFRKMTQGRDERMDTFVMRLRMQADRCKFGSRSDENIKDQVTSSCYSDTLRRKILERNHKRLESVMKMCRVFEAVSRQEKTFADESKRQSDPKREPVAMGEEVCAIGDRKRFRSQYYSQDRSDRQTPLDCSRCASKGHKSGDEKCPAIGKKCGRCGKMDHFARKCFTKVSTGNSLERETVRMINTGNRSPLPLKRETVRVIDAYDDYDDTF